MTVTAASPYLRRIFVRRTSMLLATLGLSALAILPSGLSALALPFVWLARREKAPADTAVTP